MADSNKIATTCETQLLQITCLVCRYSAKHFLRLRPVPIGATRLGTLLSSQTFTSERPNARCKLQEIWFSADGAHVPVSRTFLLPRATHRGAASSVHMDSAWAVCLKGIDKLICLC